MKKIAIIGLGMMGGSIAKAIRHYNVTDILSGFDIQAASLAYAKQHQLIDQTNTSLTDTIQDAELIIIASPAWTMASIFQEIYPQLKPEQTITDIASTKQNTIEYSQYLHEKRDQFIPGHPIIGSEKSNIESAIDHLFMDAHVILTPTQTTNAHALALVKQFWENLGAQVSTCSAQQHDEQLALISHLPHLVASAYMQLIHDPALTNIAGAGFRDFTRIAAASPSLWTNICLDNQAMLTKQLDQLIDELQHWRNCINHNNKHELLERFERAQQRRKKNDLI